MAIQTLSLPFTSWREGLLALAGALEDPHRERIVVERLEATAAKIGIGPRDICSLALLVTSRARLESYPRPEPPPEVARMIEIANASGELNRLMVGIVDDVESRQEAQKRKVFSAFPETDPRRLLNDTIFGAAAAELSDVTQRLGEADPFSRLAVRLALWFKRFDDFSRYGCSLPHDGWAVVGLVRRLAATLQCDDADRFRKLIAIWSGDVEVLLGHEGIEALMSLLPRPEKLFRMDSLDVILVLEILGALAGDSENFDVEMLEEIPPILERLPKWLDDGRPRTADLMAWLHAQESDGSSRFRLVYDPGSAFSSAQYSEQADVLEPLLEATLELMSQAGHSVFPTGPLPMRGTIFEPGRKMRRTLEEKAPEAAELFRLFGIGGDRNEMDGPHPCQSLWTGDHDPAAITFPEVITDAADRGDHALCDMLIGGWLLFCTLHRREPLPDLVALARLITALPADHRSSVYAVLGFIKRESVDIPQLRRDIGGVLSWLPLVDTAPQEDFFSILREVFTPAVWDTIGPGERDSLVEAESLFVRARRMRQGERSGEPIDAMIVRWSRVAEPVLRRVLSVLGTPAEGRPLGQLIGTAKRTLQKSSDSWSPEEQARFRFLPVALHELDRLDWVNKKGVKHTDGLELKWTHVVEIHTGIHWTMKTLLEATLGPANQGSGV